LGELGDSSLKRVSLLETASNPEKIQT